MPLHDSRFNRQTVGPILLYAGFIFLGALMTVPSVRDSDQENQRVAVHFMNVTVTTLILWTITIIAFWIENRRAQMLSFFVIFMIANVFFTLAPGVKFTRWLTSVLLSSLNQ